MKPAPCTYPLRWQCDRSLMTFAPPEHGAMRSARMPGMNHLESFELGALDTPSQSPAILVVAGALRFACLAFILCRTHSIPSLHWSESPKVRKSASPQVRKSASPQVRKSASPQVRKSASPQVRKSASPQVCKSASPSLCSASAPNRKMTKQQANLHRSNDHAVADDPLW